MKRVLIIEDDVSIAEIERDFLEINGYEVTIIHDGKQGFIEALNNSYQLVLLDLMLPSMSGFDICKQLREQIDIPILIVTARVEDVDKIRGLGLGADDFITKPFSLPELVARVQANIAQYERIRKDQKRKQVNVLEFSPIKIHLHSHRVFVDEQEIELKNKEYELLVFLMNNVDVVFSKEYLYEKIWGMDAFGDLKTVVVHINRIREKIELDPQNPKFIQTVWGAGYRFKIIK